MSLWHIVGVDPGLVHTGVVRLILDEGEVAHEHALIDGLDAQAAADWIYSYPTRPDHIYVEKYDPRHNFSVDERMIKGEVLFKQALKNAEFIRNMGSTKAVPIVVLDLMGLWNFSTTSHHQDLRSAARIAIFGAMKNPLTNTTLADMMRDSIDGIPWAVNDMGGGRISASVLD